jgi:hypothetical protein
MEETELDDAPDDTSNVAACILVLSTSNGWQANVEAIPAKLPDKMEFRTTFSCCSCCGNCTDGVFTGRKDERVVVVVIGVVGVTTLTSGVDMRCVMNPLVQYSMVVKLDGCLEDRLSYASTVPCVSFLRTYRCVSIILC